MYAKQKLYEALHSLTGTGSIQERLTSAAIPLIVLRSPGDAGLGEHRAELEAIVAALTAKPLSDTSGYLPRELSNDDANDIADRILSLFVRVMGGL